MNRQEQQIILLLAVILLGVYIYLSYGQAIQQALSLNTSRPQHLEYSQVILPETNTERFLLGLPMPLNTATERELEFIPGIGPKFAERIVSFRKQNGPFKKVSDLKKIKGIGEKRLRQITSYVTIENRLTSEVPSCLPMVPTPEIKAAERLSNQS